MSLRYTGAWMQDGAFNPFASPPTNYTYEMWSWGRNDFGQLGLGNRTYYSSPKQVGSLTDWLNTVNLYYSTLAVKTDGTLWAWGYNTNGELGLGNTIHYSSPKQVGSLTNWSSVGSGYFHVLAIKSNGTLWSWGYNAQGQLGLGNRTSYSSPMQVGALNTWSYVAAGGGMMSYAVKNDGTLWAWGTNGFGQLGLGNVTSYSSPKQVGSLTNWSAAKISFYNTFVMAAKSNGELWGWGRNGNGCLGLGNNTYYSSPKQVGYLTNWLTVAAGYYNTSSTKTDGTLWSWGNNANGQLGLGNTTNYNSPRQVGSLTNWSAVYKYRFYSLSKKSDGTLWSWGENNVGQLGLNNRTNYSSPKQIGSGSTWRSASCGQANAIALKY